MSTHVVIAGSSGLIGSALTRSLEADGVRVTRLVRRHATAENDVRWDPARGELPKDVFDGATAVVNLCGAPISDLPWTRATKENLYASRILPTQTLARALRELGSNAPLFISASAVGIYGSQPGAVLTEDAHTGTTFLARLAAAWEHAAMSHGAYVPTAVIRTASVIDRHAILRPLIPLTRLGLSGPLGSGQQVWPWISLQDEIRAIRHIIAHRMTGPVNLCSPERTTANHLGSELAHQLHRPFALPVPSWTLRMVLGDDAASSLLLADADVHPSRLVEEGFTFTTPDIHAAIAQALR